MVRFRGFLSGRPSGTDVPDATLHLTARTRIRWLALLVASVLVATVLAGCVDDLDGDPDDATPDPADHVFGDGTGVGAVAPLIPLTNDTSADARAILDTCRGDDLVACATEHLEAVMGAHGSLYAFDLLEEMSNTDATMKRADHPVAHDLGAVALHTYGTIGETLATCSHKVFQGCFHGALQEYFRHVPLEAESLEGICSKDAPSFDRYACNHGLGHGLLIAVDYDLERALDLCASIERRDRHNCYSGAFMENVVAYIDFKRGKGHAAHSDDDGHVHAPMFWVKVDDPLYPCNVINTDYVDNCWRMQTSLVLYLNKGDFQEVAEICTELSEDHHRSCFRSMGRDASAYSQHDPQGVSNKCANAPTNQSHAWCIHGFVSDVVTNYADPEAALPSCQAIREENKEACYGGLGRAGRSMAGPEELAAVCAQVEEGYEAVCREGARLD